MNKYVLRCMTGVFTLLLSATVIAASPPSLEPTPLQFPSKFGSMSFPATFPAGTTLSITQWSHFVPRYDKWFDQYAQEWGKRNNVKVTVQHINLTDLTPTLAAAIAARKGSTLFEMISTPASFVEGLQNLNDVHEAAVQTFGEEEKVCASQTYLPTKNSWYGYCHGWVPDTGNYRVSLWKDAGYPNGPRTYEDLYAGGVKIFQKTGIPVGIDMSADLDSEFSARSLIWSFGGSLFDECGNVALDSPQVVQAVKYQTKLFKHAQTPEVFAWNPSSNNVAFISGQASYIQNSISFYRTAQRTNPKVTEDTGFVPGLKGPSNRVYLIAHVWYIYVIPKYVTDKQQILAAKKFLLDLTANSSWATYESELYNFPAYSKALPQLWAKGGWLDHDPFGSVPANKLKLLRDAPKEVAWPGYPGYANPAVSEVYNTHLLSTMFSRAARGAETPEQSVKTTAAQIGKIVAKWKAKGYVGCKAH